ncbi:MAG: methyltransferase domain-containing protein [Pseudomonadota bacterium]
MEIRETVKDYYGKRLTATEDLKTNVCCIASGAPNWVAPLLANIHPDVSGRFYGCGMLLPEALEGAVVLDLGCGTGRDVYLLSQLVGETGRVIGVDMTEEQLAVARDTQDWHRDRFGHAAANTEFHLGYIEQLDALPIEPGSVDVIVSNCVINLSPDKASVLAGAYRLLKPGGEMYFSDIYADRRIGAELRADPMLYGECLTGALYTRDFERIAAETGFARPRVLRWNPVEVSSSEARAKIANIGFSSVLYRSFKLSDRPGEEDYGQTACYNGGLTGAEEGLELDQDTVLPVGEETRVSAETFAILSESRLAAYVELTGGDGVHRGAFDARNGATAAEARATCCGGA